MSESVVVGEEEGGPSGCVEEGGPSSAAGACISRKEKRKASKREKRKQKRKELAEIARQEEEAFLKDPEEQRRIQLEEERENERMERERIEFEKRERMFLEALEARRRAEEEEEERRRVIEEELKRNQAGNENEFNENGDEDWEYVEEGPPEIIWQGNEIIVKKKSVRVKKKDSDQQAKKEDPDRPTSNPLPPQSEAFADYKNASVLSAQELLENVAQQIPNFGTEQDKAHCPFHLKTAACRFGSRCSRVHFYPDKSCTLLIKNMYSGPGLAWEQDEGLEFLACKWLDYTDEEVERCYEEFYEDVHTEFLKFGEIVNFKVCRNGSFHLRGNVYVHYKFLDSAVLAYHSVNCRYFAGKQVKCEFVGVTRWKVAICGEYMKSKLKTCSRGTACNFIHCFRNPGGDYEWADWDKPPPRYWVKKMASLFCYSDESGYDKQFEQESSGQPRSSSKMLTADKERYNYRRSQSRERNSLHQRSHRSLSDKNDVRKGTHQRRRTNDDRKRLKILDDENCGERTNSRNNQHKNGPHDTDSDGDWSVRDRDGDRNHKSAGKRSRAMIKGLDFHDYHRHSNSRACETDGGRDLEDRDRRTDRHHILTRKSSKHQKNVSEILDDFDDIKNRTCSADSSEDKLGEARGRGRHHHDNRKSLELQKRESTFLDDHWDNRSHYSDSSGDWSDRNGKRDHDRTRPSSRRSSSYKEAREADFPSEHLKAGHNRETTDLRIKSLRHDSRSDSDRYSNKVGDLGSDGEFPKKRKKYAKKLTSHEHLEFDSPARYNGGSRTLDSEYDADERGRWVPDDSS